jgi:predicted transcriptional regulator
MKIAFGLIGTVFIATATTLYNFNLKASGLICALTGILLFIVLVYIYIKDRNLEKYKMNSQESDGFKVTGVGTDDDTRLVIKAICDESHGFVSFNDIAKDTNLSLKTINKTLDWLFINNFLKEIKARNGKVYALTPEGKSVFSQLIAQHLGTNSA